MFCHKCGTEIAEGAEFCHKCGTKVATVPVEPVAMPVVSESAPVQEPQQVPVPSVAMDDTNEFRTFVDNHVRATTKYQSAEELLNCKPMWFVAICFGVCALIGLLLGARLGDPTDFLIGLLVFGGLFGYVVTFIASGVIRKKYRDKFYGEFEQEISIEDFLVFLNGHLKTLSPYFHECCYSNPRGGLLVHISNAVASAFKEVTLVCICGPREKSLATITIRPHIMDPDSGRKQYIVGASYHGFLIDFRAAGFLGHSCLIKTAPIMQATMEYYLKYYAKSEGGNENVLH